MLQKSGVDKKTVKEVFIKAQGEMSKCSDKKGEKSGKRYIQRRESNYPEKSAAEYIQIHDTLAYKKRHEFICITVY